jgi:NADPH-dependent 2,4-dienoyl-CoA reductase/sulfur reductase-like enzyme
MDHDPRVAIIGAGPYGLACAAHLRHSGVEPWVFGEPMGYWRTHMPRGMLLRSRRCASHIADPTQALTIDEYEKSTGTRLSEPIELESYVEYADWFRQAAAPNVDRRRVQRIDRVDGSFNLTLEDGQEIGADRVVLAAGLEPFAWRPPPLGDLPRDLVSHSSDYEELATLSGKRVMVVGAGQSALESAAILHESGAEVEIVARAPGIVWLAPEQRPGIRGRMSQLTMPPTGVGGRGSGWIAAAPELFRRVPARLRPEITERCIAPKGSDWLRPRLAKVPKLFGCAVVEAAPAESGIRVTLDNGTVRERDHVVLGTGFWVDVARYPFLSPELVRELDLLGGYPRLGPGLESSVPGLHFVGAPATLSFGPLMRFVVGTWHAAPALARSVLGRRQRVVGLSYKPRVVLRPRPEPTFIPARDSEGARRCLHPTLAARKRV